MVKSKHLCECGCLQFTEIDRHGNPNRFIKNHYQKLGKPKNIRKQRLCACGCGEWTHGIYIYGHRKKKIKTIFRDKVVNIDNIRICRVCGKDIPNNAIGHHIIPRKYGGHDNIENKIDLCFSCHDEIEMATEDWIESGKRCDVDLLRSMIINNGFPVSN